MGDGSTLTLLLIALIPGRVFPAWLGVALRFRRLIVVWFAILAVATWRAPTGQVPAQLVPLQFASLALAALYPFLEFVGIWSSSPRVWLRGTAWVVLSTFWSLQIVLNLSERIVVPAGKLDYWLVDSFDKLFRATVLPLMTALGLGDATGFVLSYLADTLVFVGSNLFGVGLVVNLALSAVLYEAVRAKAPQLPPRLTLITARIPLVFAVVPAAAWIGCRLQPWIPWWSIAWQMSVALYGAAGIWLLYLLAASSKWLRIVFWASAFMHLLHPQLMAIPALLGAAHSLWPLGELVRRHTDNGWRFAASLERGLTTVRRAVHPVPALLVLIVVTFPARRIEGGLGTSAGTAPSVPTERSEAAPENMARVSWAQGAFDIDRYEFPGIAGQQPVTGESPARAAELCEAQGKHLCSRDEWYWACSEGGRRKFIIGEDRDRDLTNFLDTECNLKSDGLIPTGSKPRCRNAFEIFDLVGNAMEWVSFPSEPDWYGLVGSYYGLSDDQTKSCYFTMVVHREQVQLLDLEPVGFRCCH